MKYLFFIVLISAVFITALNVVLAKHDARRIFAELQELEKEKDRLNEEWGKLQIEQSTWATDDRVEKIARLDLDMMEPAAESLILIVQ